MEEIEARKIQILADFYNELLNIEEAFESSKKELETKFSIANNFNLDHPETYIKLIRPVSRKIKHIGNSCKLARYKLEEYRNLAPKVSEKSPESYKIITTKPQTKPQTKPPLNLEQRISRLEFLVYLILAFLIGTVANYIGEFLFTLLK